MASYRWGYIRIMAGTILGGVLGFNVMHRVETSYKEEMNRRLRMMITGQQQEEMNERLSEMMAPQQQEQQEQQRNDNPKLLSET